MKFYILFAFFILIGRAEAHEIRNTHYLTKEDYIRLAEMLDSGAEEYVSIQNTNYLLTELSKNKKLSNALLNHQDALRRELHAIQNGKSVCKWERHAGHESERLKVGKDAIPHLKPYHLARVLYMYQALRVRPFVNKVGGLIEIDLEDMNNPHVLPSEKGGLVLAHVNGVSLLPVPTINGPYLTSELGVESRVTKGDRVSSNMGYTMPAYAAIQIRNIGRFHMHSVTREHHTYPCGPSVGLDEYGKYKNSDVGNADSITERGADHHMFVFSSIGPRMFSTHYLSAYRSESGETIIVVIALPTQIY